MKPPLVFARTLYDEGLYRFSGGGITLNDTGMMAVRVADAAALERLAAPVARALRISVENALEHHIAVISPPVFAGTEPVWGTNYRPEGWLAREGLDDGALVRFMALLDYSLSEEGRAFYRYGIEGETYANVDESIFLFADPETYRAYDLAAVYPTGRFLLGFLTRDASRETDLFLPSAASVPARIKTAEAFALYYHPMNGNDARLHALHSPARDALEIDFNAHFFAIITGEEPVEEMFERFREECIRLGIEDAIREINERK
jgi:hypothetical protein